MKEEKEGGGVRAESSDLKMTKGPFRCMISIDRSTHPPPFIRWARCHPRLGFPRRCQQYTWFFIPSGVHARWPLDDQWGLIFVGVLCRVSDAGMCGGRWPVVLRLSPVWIVCCGMKVVCHQDCCYAMCWYECSFTKWKVKYLCNVRSDFSMC